MTGREMVKAMRQAAGLSQEALGVRVGRCRQWVKNVEWGRQWFTLPVVRQYCNAFDLNAEERGRLLKAAFEEAAAREGFAVVVEVGRD